MISFSQLLTPVNTTNNPTKKSTLFSIHRSCASQPTAGTITSVLPPTIGRLKPSPFLKTSSLIIIPIFFFNSLIAQVRPDTLSKTELDTAFFGWPLFEKYFYYDPDKFISNYKIYSLLENIARYNSLINRSSGIEIFKPNFIFDNKNKISNIEYYYAEKKVKVVQFTSIKDGFLISQNSSHEGTCLRLELSEYKNGERNGVSVSFNSCGSYTLEKQYFKDDYPCGKSFSYYPDGQVKVAGDSLISINHRLKSRPHYNNKGEIDKYIKVKDCDTEKKGTWRYYDESGNLLKEETFK